MLFVRILFAEKIGTVVAILQVMLLGEVTLSWIFEFILSEPIATLFPVVDDLQIKT